VVMANAPAENSEAERNFPSVREENLPRHLEAPGGVKGKDEKAPESPPAKGGDAGPPAAATPVQEGDLTKDPQLFRALELLKSWNVFKTVVAERQP
jgi:hypothetical protein